MLKKLFMATALLVVIPHQSFAQDRVTRISASLGEVDQTVSAALRESRELIRQARRSQAFDVSDRANDLLDVLRIVKVDLDAGASISELAEHNVQLRLRLRLLEDEVDDANERNLDEIYGSLDRLVNVLLQLLGEDRGTPRDAREIFAVADRGSYFKISTTMAILLPSSQKCFIGKTQSIWVTRDSDSVDTSGHAAVRLARAIPGCSFGTVGRSGYVYGPHFD